MLTRGGSSSSFRSGFNPRETSVLILALHVPTEGDARITRVHTTHHAINQGISIPRLGPYIEGAVTMRPLHTATASYYVFSPAELAGYNISEALYQETGIRRRGPIVVFQRSIQRRLFVNLRPYDDIAKAAIFEKLAEMFGTLDD